MAKFVIDDTTLTAVADAIRAKTGETGKLSPEEMPGKIAGIETEFNPSGTKEITQNGIYDVTKFAFVSVLVPGEMVEEWDGSIEVV